MMVKKSLYSIINLIELSFDGCAHIKYSYYLYEFLITVLNKIIIDYSNDYKYKWHFRRTNSTVPTTATSRCKILSGALDGTRWTRRRWYDFCSNIDWRIVASSSGSHFEGCPCSYNKSGTQYNIYYKFALYVKFKLERIFFLSGSGWLSSNFFIL